MSDWLAQYFETPEQRARRTADQRLQDQLAEWAAFSDIAERFPARKPQNTGLWQAQQAAQQRAAEREQRLLADAVARQMDEWQRRSGYLPDELRAKTDAALNAAQKRYNLPDRPTEMALSAPHMEMCRDAAVTLPAALHEVKRLRSQIKREGVEAQRQAADREALEDATGADAATDAALKIIGRRNSGTRVALADTDPRRADVQRRLEKAQGIE